jgi:alginate O-acetyltransferase complex protein AlgI
MVFSSVTFLFYFLPLFLLAYLSLPFRNLTLLLASLFFYAWGELEFVGLLVGSVALNYLAGLAISREGPRRRAALVAGIAANLLLLGIFKYAGFVAELLAPWLPGSQTPSIHFPIGVSFFTFQAMSYLVDVYRRHATAERNPLTLGTYIAMFPQLIAGPIVRFHSIQAQLHARTHDLRKFERGVRYFVIGLGQKMLIANTLATPADSIFSLPAADLTASVGWLGSICYTLQIYYDFAGYSNMAIGLGFMLGFQLPKNFDHPYISQSITEFWRRWHITLSTWFRDYLYIPLGGNRRGALRTYGNLLIVFLLCGLWHGAAWSFVVWGLYHGLFLVIERVGLANAIGRIWRPLRHLYVLFVVNIGFVIFRADSLAYAAEYLRAMAGLGLGDGVAHHLGVYLQPNVVISLALGACGSAPLFAMLETWLSRRAGTGSTLIPIATRMGVAVGLGGIWLLISMGLAAGTHNPFIYFRF